MSTSLAQITCAYITWFPTSEPLHPDLTFVLSFCNGMEDYRLTSDPACAHVAQRTTLRSLLREKRAWIHQLYIMWSTPASVSAPWGTGWKGRLALSDVDDKEPTVEAKRFKFCTSDQDVCNFNWNKTKKNPKQPWMTYIIFIIHMWSSVAQRCIILM